MGQESQICSLNCQFSSMRIASVARARLKPNSFFYEKCMLYVYSRVFWVKDFKSVVKVTNFRACALRLSRARLQPKIFFMKNACCMSIQGFLGLGFQICSQNCNYENKEIIRKKTLLQLYYNSLLNVKEHMLPHLQPVSPWSNCN